MISSRKSQLAITVILACICAPVVGAEADKAGPELKFERSDQKQQWVIDIDGRGREIVETRQEMLQGSFRPKYVAVFYVGQRLEDRFDRPMPGAFAPWWIKDVLSTSAGRSLSQLQLDLLETDACIRILGGFGNAVGNHQQVRVYAITENDAQHTAQALIEILRELTTNVSYLKHRLQELQEKIPSTKKAIPEKEAELKSTLEQLEKLKKLVYYLSRDEAKQDILELNKTLNSLEVEIAGLQAKISAIEKSESSGKLEPETLARLEAMMSEQAVELAGALARREAATKIRSRAQEFYDLSVLEIGLNQEIADLKKELSMYEMELPEAERGYAQATADELPPKVFQNKVTIYPVRVETDDPSLTNQRR